MSLRVGRVAGWASAAVLAAGLGGGGCSGAPRTDLLQDDASSGGGMTFGDDASAPIGDPLGDAGCATGSAQAKRQPVYLLFVLDGSGSMAQDNKWTSVRPALTSIFSQMEMSADTGVAAGLIVFSDTLDPTTGTGPYPSSVDVPIGFVSAAQQAALDKRLTGDAQNSTPTHAALTGGYGELDKFVAKAPLQPGGKKVLVLITDGVPSDDCMTLPIIGNYATNPCIELAGTELKQSSTETFVIGVGDFAAGSFFGLGGIDPTFLGTLAQAGGTGPTGCNPTDTTSTTGLCYFEIDPSTAPTATQLQQSFETALNAIRGQVISCTFPLQSSNLGQVDPTHVNVEVGGKTILQDPKNGWTFDDPTTPTEILLHGAACSSAQGDLSAQVSIVVGCATQIAK